MKNFFVVFIVVRLYAYFLLFIIRVPVVEQRSWVQFLGSTHSDKNLMLTLLKTVYQMHKC